MLECLDLYHLQEDEWYLQNLPRDLLPLHERTLQYSGDEFPLWTVSEVLLIVKPLLGLRAEKWTFKLRTSRLWLLERRAIPEEAEEDGKLSKFIVELGRYQVMDRKESLDAVQIREEATSADELYGEVKRLLRLKRWTENNVQNMISKLSGISGIDAQISSEQAMDAWLDFSPRWTRFVSDHPAVASQLI
jgi:hypothetical protein